MHFRFSYIFLTLLLPSFLNSKAQQFEIQGKILNAERKKLYLIKSDGRPFYLENQPIIILDSAIVKNGLFNFKGTIEQTDNVALKVKDGRQFSFILQSGTTKISTDGNALWLTQIANSSENDYYQGLRKTYQWTADSANKFADEYSFHISKKDGQAALHDSLRYVYYNKRLDSLNMQNTALFITSHPASFVGLNQLHLLLELYGTEKSRELLSILEPNFKEHPLRGIISSKISQLENPVKIGLPCPDFTLADTSGKPVAFKTVKAKLTLIDFWASWCVPCRKEHPELRKTYAVLRNQGLEIVSVSLDISRKSWLKALSADKLSWINLSDLKGFSGDVAILFNVSAIPTNFLVDEKGTIVEMNVKGMDLVKHVKKYLAN